MKSQKERGKDFSFTWCSSFGLLPWFFVLLTKYKVEAASACHGNIVTAARIRIFSSVLCCCWWCCFRSVGRGLAITGGDLFADNFWHLWQCPTGAWPGNKPEQCRVRARPCKIANGQHQHLPWSVRVCKGDGRTRIAKGTFLHRDADLKASYLCCVFATCGHTGKSLRQGKYD